MELIDYDPDTTPGLPTSEAQSNALTLSQKAVDISFLSIFCLTVLFLVFTSYKSFKSQQGRDIFNTLTILFLYLTIFSNILR